MQELPQRKRLHHVPPLWVKAGSIYFITINAAQRRSTALLDGETPQRLLNSARYYHDSAAWWLEFFLLMPDHLHALVAVPTDQQLDRTITAWKSYQAKTAWIAWQSGFFDHRLRSDESLEEKVHYIRMNPVRAGLVARPEQWPHVWSPV